MFCSDSWTLNLRSSRVWWLRIFLYFPWIWVLLLHTDFTSAVRRNPHFRQTEPNPSCAGSRGRSSQHYHSTPGTRSTVAVGHSSTVGPGACPRPHTTGRDEASHRPTDRISTSSRLFQTRLSARAAASCWVSFIKPSPGCVCSSDSSEGEKCGIHLALSSGQLVGTEQICRSGWGGGGGGGDSAIKKNTIEAKSASFYCFMVIEHQHARVTESCSSTEWRPLIFSSLRLHPLTGVRLFSSIDLIPSLLLCSSGVGKTIVRK